LNYTPPIQSTQNLLFPDHLGDKYKALQEQPSTATKTVAPCVTGSSSCLYKAVRVSFYFYSKRKFSTTTKIIFEPVELNVAKMYQSLENISSLYSTIRKDDKKEEEKTNKHERCSIQIWIFEEI